MKSLGLKLRQSVSSGLVFVLASYLGYYFLVEAGQSAALNQKYPFAPPPPFRPRLEAVFADFYMLFNYSGVPRAI